MTAVKRRRERCLRPGAVGGPSALWSASGLFGRFHPATVAATRRNRLKQAASTPAGCFIVHRSCTPALLMPGGLPPYKTFRGKAVGSDLLRCFYRPGFFHPRKRPGLHHTTRRNRLKQDWGFIVAPLNTTITVAWTAEERQALEQVSPLALRRQAESRLMAAQALTAPPGFCLDVRHAVFEDGLVWTGPAAEIPGLADLTSYWEPSTGIYFALETPVRLCRFATLPELAEVVHDFTAVLEASTRAAATFASASTRAVQ